MSSREDRTGFALLLAVAKSAKVAPPTTAPSVAVSTLQRIKENEKFFPKIPALTSVKNKIVKNNIKPKQNVSTGSFFLEDSEDGQTVYRRASVYFSIVKSSRKFPGYFNPVEKRIIVNWTKNIAAGGVDPPDADVVVTARTGSGREHHKVTRVWNYHQVKAWYQTLYQRLCSTKKVNEHVKSSQTSNYPMPNQVPMFLNIPQAQQQQFIHSRSSNSNIIKKNNLKRSNPSSNSYSNSHQSSQQQNSNINMMNMNGLNMMNLSNYGPAAAFSGLNQGLDQGMNNNASMNGTISHQQMTMMQQLQAQNQIMQQQMLAQHKMLLQQQQQNQQALLRRQQALQHFEKMPIPTTVAVASDQSSPSSTVDKSSAMKTNSNATKQAVAALTAAGAALINGVVDQPPTKRKKMDL